MSSVDDNIGAIIDDVGITKRAEKTRSVGGVVVEQAVSGEPPLPDYRYLNPN